MWCIALVQSKIEEVFQTEAERTLKRRVQELEMDVLEKRARITMLEAEVSKANDAAKVTQVIARRMVTKIAGSLVSCFGNRSWLYVL